MPEIKKASDDHRHFRVGVDVGGTFTDVVLVEETTGEILVAKVATVPADPSEGCIDAIDKAIRHYALEPRQFAFTVHGTTIATNTIIEGKGAKAGLITSEGFRDVLEIASHVERAFIGGRSVDLTDRQKLLYKKYEEKYRRQAR